MGNDDNIILTMLAKAAIASEMDGQETLANMKEAVDKITPAELDKKIAQLKSK